MSVNDLRKDLKQYWREEKSDFLQKYFFAKDGNASRDIFHGISVPNSRIVAKKYTNLELNEIEELLTSEVHEERLIALFILVMQYQKGNEETKVKVVEFFLKHTKYINEWDLVDSSADRILGDYLIDQPKELLLKFAESKNWWERRIAIMATFQFIKVLKEEEWTFIIAEKLLDDKHDLVHKAVGWMLREVGNRISMDVEMRFLNEHYKKMPRTMLRYAIEKFSEDVRQSYLKGTI